MNGINAKRAVERCNRIAKLGRIPPWWRLLARRRWIRSFQSIMALDIGEAAEMLRGLYTSESVQEMANRPNHTLRGLVKSTHGGPFVEVVERVQIGADGQSDEATRSIEIHE